MDWEVIEDRNHPGDWRVEAINHEGDGEVYVTIESPRGESGCYVVSDGGPRPWRVKFRAPSFVALEATATCMRDSLIADMIAIVGSLDTVMGEVDR